MATYRQIINRVLVAVGQADDQVDSAAISLTDKYHIKVAQFVNDILEEVEGAAQWRVLRTRDTVTISADAVSGALTNSNERSRAFKVHDANRGELVPLVFDVTDGSAQRRLQEMDLAELIRRDQSASNATQGNGPVWYALSPTASGMDIFVYPRTSTAINIEADMVIPTSRLPHGTLAELSAVIQVPTLPVALGSTWWAQEDLGEELGPQGQRAEIRFRLELAGAVSLEHAQQGFDTLVPV